MQGVSGLFSRCALKPFQFIVTSGRTTRFNLALLFAISGCSLNIKVSRRQARERALQILFQMDFNPALDSTEALRLFDLTFKFQDETLDSFSENLVRGIAGKLSEIDAVLNRVSNAWRSDRMTAVDRNILRIGVYEILHCDDVPAVVTINEMVELAKQYGSEHSASFVNGLLDRVQKDFPNVNKKA